MDEGGCRRSINSLPGGRKGEMGRAGMGGNGRGSCEGRVGSSGSVRLTRQLSSFCMPGLSAGKLVLTPKRCCPLIALPSPPDQQTVRRSFLGA